MKQYKSLFSVINSVLEESAQVHTVMMNNGEKYIHHGTFRTKKEADDEAENLHFYKLGTKVITHDDGYTRLAMRNPVQFLKSVKSKLSEEEELKEAFKDYDFEKNREIFLNENLLLNLYQKYKEHKNKKYYTVFYNNSAYDDGEFSSEGQWRYHSHHADLGGANGAKRTLGEFKSHDSPMNIRIIDLNKDQLEIAKKKPHALMKHFEKQISGGNEEEKPLTADASFKEWHRINKEKFKEPTYAKEARYDDYQNWARLNRHQYLSKQAFHPIAKKLGITKDLDPKSVESLTHKETEAIKTSHYAEFDPKDPYKTIRRYDEPLQGKKK